MPAVKSVLVTGGAGYIGSHTSWQLVEAGYRVTVLDNFYSGYRWAVPARAELIEGDAGDLDLVCHTLREKDIGSVIHFAGHIVIPESVADPLKYYRNNTCVSRNLIDACLAEGVSNFVFSSSAAVYGTPEQVPIAETAMTLPISPYGTSKLMTEWMLRDVAAGPEIAAANRFRYVALRYFNVAGARLDGALGQATEDATHLIKVACQAACGLRDYVPIYGTDYNTADGTCIRDYIHVEDLAAAHLAALDYLERGGSSETLNCGYGRGYSVREALNMVKRVSATDFPVREESRRPGDAAMLVSDPSRLLRLLDWHPRYADLKTICESAFRWEISRKPISRQVSGLLPRSRHETR
jgi:UDP-glucose 4-epimerase